MKYAGRIALLSFLLSLCTALGMAQNSNTSTQPLDKTAQKQAERERKAKEKEEAKRLQQQAGVRCSRLRGKH